MLPSGTGQLTGIPMFPLPDFYLFPGSVVPLHIFEPRYRQMVDDLLDTAGRLVMTAVRSEHARQLEDSPPVFPVGGLGEIIHHKKLPDSRYLIWLLGLGRVGMEEVPSDRLYRCVDAWIIPDDAGDPDENGSLIPRLITAIKIHEPHGVEVSEDLPAGLLADILLHNLSLRPHQLETVFAERNMTRRAALALGWHDSLPEPTED